MIIRFVFWEGSFIVKVLEAEYKVRKNGQPNADISRLLKMASDWATEKQNQTAVTIEWFPNK